MEELYKICTPNIAVEGNFHKLQTLMPTEIVEHNTEVESESLASLLLDSGCVIPVKFSRIIIKQGCILAYYKK